MRHASKFRSKSNEVCDDPQRARVKALELLTGRELTGRQLCDKLKQRGFSESACQSVLDSFVEVSLIDDRRTAEMLLQKYMRMAYSRSTMRQKLQQAGLSRELIDEQIATVDEGMELENARKQARRVASRPTEKAMASLQRKGFRSSQTRAAVGETHEVDPD